MALSARCACSDHGLSSKPPIPPRVPFSPQSRDDHADRSIGAHCWRRTACYMRAPIGAGLSGASRGFTPIPRRLAVQNPDADYGLFPSSESLVRLDSAPARLSSIFPLRTRRSRALILFYNAGFRSTCSCAATTRTGPWTPTAVGAVSTQPLFCPRWPCRCILCVHRDAPSSSCRESRPWTGVQLTALVQHTTLLYIRAHTHIAVPHPGL